MMRDDQDVAVHDQARAPWEGAGSGPTVRQRTGAQHAVRRVLDALAPERQPTCRAEVREAREAVRRYRSPRGCILQGEGRAVSVSWFPSDPSDARFGELRVIAWAGVVSRPGASRRVAGGARVLAEYQLRPVESPGAEWAWRELDGDELSASAVVARCLGDLDGHTGGAV